MLDAKGTIETVLTAGNVLNRYRRIFDTDEFSTEFPKDKWVYLGRGIMVKTERVELVHLEETDEDVEIIEIGELSD